MSTRVGQHAHVDQHLLDEVTTEACLSGKGADTELAAGRNGCQTLSHQVARLIARAPRSSWTGRVSGERLEAAEAKAVAP